MNDVLLKSCTGIVEGGTCKAYGLHMMDTVADDSSVVKVSEPLDVHYSWK